MKVRNWFIAVFFGAALTLFVYSCESSDDGSPTGPISSAKLSKSGAQDPTSERKAARAQAEMERVLSDIYDADEVALDRIDFSEADRLYREAIEADPSNTEAQFGAAITSLLVLAINEDVRAAQDSLNAYMGNEGGEIFLGSLDLVSTTEVAGRLPLMTAEMTQDAIANPFKVSDLQQTISEEIIPAIDYSLERLQIVEGDLDFTFELTPKMQGDEYEETREIDLGEAYMIDAQLRLLKAVFQVAIAYNFDFDDNGSYASFDDDSDENILRQMERLDKTVLFMTLRTPDAMRDAKTSILVAIDKIEEGLGAIRLETDDQDDDIILAEDLDDLDDEIDLSDQGDDVPAFFREIRTVNTALRKAREILEGTVEIEADFDGDSYTPKQTVIFDVGQFFDNPIEDLRTLLPYHTWHLDLLQNRNFADELVLTDAEGNALEDSPPLVFPDPSFGGVFSNISTNEQLLDLFGINDENHNRKDLLYELGLVRWRDGGIVVTNKATAAIEVKYSGELVGNTRLSFHSVTVGQGTEGLDVVRSEFGRPFTGGSWIRLNIQEDGRYTFDYEFWSDGNMYITIYDDDLTIDVPKKYYPPWDVYESYILELP